MERTGLATVLVIALVRILVLENVLALGKLGNGLAFVLVLVIVIAIVIVIVFAFVRLFVLVLVIVHHFEHFAMGQCLHCRQ